MRFILLPLTAAFALTACGEEPEISQAETPNVVDPVDTRTENVTSDPPAGTSAGWDVNNDRNFDRAEFTGYGDRGFLGWDDDNDRRLTQTEFNAGWSQAGWQQPDNAFTAFDDNRDGALAQDEFFGDDEFGEWDRNGNGVLEDDEWLFDSV